MEVSQMKRFIHDCENCLFVGQFQEYDLYFCDQGGFSPTVIARYGSDGPEYTSGINFSHPVLQETQQRALEILVQP
jgi:hypothetical protein